MKVGQKTIVRWMSKRATKPTEASQRRPLGALSELDTEQLRHVGGGNGGIQLPKVGW
jgi:hypothetical protein